jgi:hypothetical protein
MLEIAYRRIKQADPKALVISAGLSSTTSWDEIPDVEFLKRMYVAGARPYFDLLGAHPTGFKAPPETNPADLAAGKYKEYCHYDECASVYCFRHLEELRAVLTQDGRTLVVAAIDGRTTCSAGMDAVEAAAPAYQCASETSER